MSDREVMQQALDALNLPSLKTQQMLQQRDEAIATLRAALEQPEQKPTCPECKAAVLYECVACSSNNYPPPAHPEQEPVALIRDGVLRWYIPREHYSRPAWTLHGTHMLYAQPQPPRKPLTDEDIEQAQRTVWRSLPSDFDYTTSSWIEIGIRCAEAAHGIKGEA